MDNLQSSQVHKTDKVTFIRQVPWCALVQSPSLSLQGQALRKSLFTSDIFGTVTRIAAMVNSSGLAQTAGWRPLTFTLSLPWKLACCHSLLCSLSMTHRARSGSAHCVIRAARSMPRLCIPKEHLGGIWHCPWAWYPNLLLLQAGITWLPTFAFQASMMKRTYFLGFSSRWSRRSSQNCSTSVSLALIFGA